MRVLVVQTGFLGDLVLTTPLLRELRRLPQVRIDVVSTPAGAELFGGLPWVDEAICLDKARAGPRAVVRLGLRLRRGRYDVAVAAHRSHRSGLLVRMSGAPRRIGFRGAPGAWAYTVSVPRKSASHAVRRYLALAAPLGASPSTADPRPELRPGSRAVRRADRLLEAHGVRDEERLLAIAPGSVWATKRWLPERFAEVADAGWELGLRPLLLGSAGERIQCRGIAERCSAPVVVLAGRTGVAELAALLLRTVALVSNDSGPAHVASAVGRPVIAVFGPTVPSMGYAPVGSANHIVEHPGLGCRPCSRHGTRRCPLGHFRCMREIPAERVVARLRRLLAAPPMRRRATGGTAPAARRRG